MPNERDNFILYILRTKTNLLYDSMERIWYIFPFFVAHARAHDERVPMPLLPLRRSWKRKAAHSPTQLPPRKTRQSSSPSSGVERSDRYYQIHRHCPIILGLLSSRHHNHHNHYDHNDGHLYAIYVPIGRLFSHSPGLRLTTVATGGRFGFRRGCWWETPPRLRAGRNPCCHRSTGKFSPSRRSATKFFYDISFSLKRILLIKCYFYREKTQCPRSTPIRLWLLVSRRNLVLPEWMSFFFKFIFARVASSDSITRLFLDCLTSNGFRFFS